MSTTTTLYKHPVATPLLTFIGVALVIIASVIAFRDDHGDFQPQKHGAQVITTVDLDMWSHTLANRLNNAGEYQEQIAILANSWCAVSMGLTSKDPNVRNAATLEQIDVADFVRQAELQWTDRPVVADYQAATLALCGFTPDAPYGG